MTLNLSADLNERRSVTARRASAALFALAVSVAVPFAPARAVVPAAPAWAHPAEVNQQVIKVGFEETKARRLKRGTQCKSAELDSSTDCSKITGCKWQQTIHLVGLRAGPCYCYASAPLVEKGPFNTQKPQ